MDQNNEDDEDKEYDDDGDDEAIVCFLIKIFISCQSTCQTSNT